MMTTANVQEYAAAIRQRYRAANRKGKGRILDEFCMVTDYHRKAAVRLLRHPTVPAKPRAGRPKEYGLSVVQALWEVWEASDRLCSKRLVPFLPELLPILQRHGELQVTEESKSLLLPAGLFAVDSASLIAGHGSGGDETARHGEADGRIGVTKRGLRWRSAGR